MLFVRFLVLWSFSVPELKGRLDLLDFSFALQVIEGSPCKIPRGRKRLPNSFAKKLQIGIGIGKFSTINSEELHIGNFLGGGSLKGDRSRYR